VKFNDNSASLRLVKLAPLMELTSGRPEIAIGLIDGPVETNHSDLALENIRHFAGRSAGCENAGSRACVHGTFVASILLGRRASIGPAICPGCTLLVLPIFEEAQGTSEQMFSTTPEFLARAITEVVAAGVRILNLSVALVQPSRQGEQELGRALDYAAQRGTIVVAAAGNEGGLGSSAITRHQCVIPVVAYDLQGRPMVSSNLGGSIGRRGLGAPGDGIASRLGAGGGPLIAGTSVAAPFVSGAIALLWSEFLGATASEVRFAVIRASAPRRRSVVPPLLNAWGSYRIMAEARA
jgi:subtilisin family serine protease